MGPTKYSEFNTCDFISTNVLIKISLIFYLNLLDIIIKPKSSFIIKQRAREDSVLGIGLTKHGTTNLASE